MTKLVVRVRFGEGVVWEGPGQSKTKSLTMLYFHFPLPKSQTPLLQPCLIYRLSFEERVKWSDDQGDSEHQASS